jgi:ribosome maturation factor RimP
VDGDLVAINLDGEAETALLPFSWIVDAKLVVTDALMKRGANARAARLEAENSNSIQSEIQLNKDPVA